MHGDSSVREAMLAVHARPRDARARVTLAKAFLRAGKPELALECATDAYRMRRTRENAALVRRISMLVEPPTIVAFPQPQTTVIPLPQIIERVPATSLIALPVPRPPRKARPAAPPALPRERSAVPLLLLAVGFLALTSTLIALLRH